jgi:hypothetical protein
MTIELGHYGFMLDTEWAYIALSWQLLATAFAIIVGVKVYHKVKSNKQVTPLVIEDNDDWMTK